jgi:hypothetical protein
MSGNSPSILRLTLTDVPASQSPIVSVIAMREEKARVMLTKRGRSPRPLAYMCDENVFNIHRGHVGCTVPLRTGGKFSSSTYKRV